MRTVHFIVPLYFLFFIASHVIMVFITSPRVNLNHITRGVDADGPCPRRLADGRDGALAPERGIHRRGHLSLLLDERYSARQ